MALNRRLRGILGLGATWGVAFSALSLSLVAIGVATTSMPIVQFGVGDYLAMGIRGFLAGGLAGSVFAALVARRERGRSLSGMSDERMALWGFLGGAPVPWVAVALSGMQGVPLGAFVTASVLYGVVGGSLGVATIRVARRAPELSATDEPLTQLPPVSQAR